jgi:hypothetical protein
MRPASASYELRDLITALDRRISQLARVGERQIARDIEALRDKVAARRSELARADEERRMARADGRTGTPRQGEFERDDVGLLSFVPAYSD